MRVLRNIVINLFLIVVIYLLVLWDVWGVVLIILAIPFGLLLGLLLLGFVVAGLIAFFSKQVKFPHIRPPKDLMEISMLLHKIIDSDHGSDNSEWSQYEKEFNIAWAQFVFSSDEDIQGGDFFRVQIKQVIEIEKKHEIDQIDYDCEIGPIYRGDDVKRELGGLADKWFSEAQILGLEKENYSDYLKDECLEISSPARRIVQRLLMRA